MTFLFSLAIHTPLEVSPLSRVSFGHLNNSDTTPPLLVVAMNQFGYKESYRRNLPHFQPPEATIFVTFRLDGSLPKPVIEQWRREKIELEMSLHKWSATSPQDARPDPIAMADEKLNFHRRWFKKFETILDGTTAGPLWLKDDRIAEIVAKAIHYRDGAVYRLDSYTIMPNHVHIVFAPFLNEQLARELTDKNIRDRCRKTTYSVQTREEMTKVALASIMQSLKGWTARQCNMALNRSGQFWQHESYDHVIRNQAEWERIVNYVINNPVKAGLVAHWQDWKWSYRRQTSNGTERP